MEIRTQTSALMPFWPVAIRRPDWLTRHARHVAVVAAQKRLLARGEQRGGDHVGTGEVVHALRVGRIGRETAGTDALAMRGVGGRGGRRAT